MMSALESLFHGIVVLIDDEVNDANSSINKLASQIEEKDCHVIKIPKLPTDGQLDNLVEAAFFILDWNLYNIQAETDGSGDVPIVHLPQELTKKHIEENISFLEKIRERRFAPIFIFTNEDIAAVEGVLSDNALYSGKSSDHIFVQNKETVITQGVFKILEDWVRVHPSAYVLKQWEAEYTKARNTFFIDFYSNSHLWPVVLWKTYSQDSISEAAELTSLIGRNILSRLAPVPFDAKILGSHVDAANGEIKSKELYKVLEGERFIRNERLQNDISVGDVFKKNNEFFVNIRPECDCVARNGIEDDDIELYLIKGSEIKNEKFHENYNKKLGNMTDKDITNTIFAMFEGITVCFKFKEFRIEKWKDWKDKRIGRLIPPYSTRLQQRFASFIQRVGLARIPGEAIPKKGK